MIKIHGFKYLICLSSSLSLNLFFFYLIVDGQIELTWTKNAAFEAEEAASILCSGHGRAFIDGNVSRGGKKPTCECFSCYGGSDCSQFSPRCPADAESGDPLFLEPYWTQEATQSAVLVAGWHRMSYDMADGASISSELEWHIRRLHAVVGNAVAEGQFIVFGTGSTQLLNAAVHGLSLDTSSSSTPVSVVASAPYYSGYREQTTFFASTNYKWQGDSYQWMNASNPSMKFIEFVTSPNNPDGRLREAVLGGPFVKTIHDHAYYWPHYTAIPAPVDEDIMLFTMSKLTGHAGSRFGWALIKDESLYERVSRYVDLNTMGVSHDTQLRALKLLKVVLQGGGGGEIFGYGYQVMRDRWMKLSKVLSTSKRISLQKLAPQYCTYFRKIRGPSPAYAWLRCEMEEETDCHAILKAAGIIGRSGTKFGFESRFVRLSLLKSKDDFNWLLQRITAFVAEESAKSI
ncbi:hypothetical protein AAC387_Pa03g3633 [Persea americana]